MFSIIIPYGNTPIDLLEECLQSIEMQNLPADMVEVRIVNDGGPKFELDTSRYQHMEVCYERYDNNMGPGYARQFGIDHTTQPYVVFLDSDDRLVPGALRRFIDVIESYTGETPIDVIYATRIQSFPHGHMDQLAEDDNVFPDNIHGLCVALDFIKRNQIRFLNEFFHEDGLYTVSLFAHNPTILTADGAAVQHRYGRYESLATLHNVALYDLSILVSNVTIYENFLREQYKCYITEPTTTPYASTFLSRMAEVDFSHMQDPNVEGLIYYVYGCFWRMFPYVQQEKIKNNFPSVDFDNIQVPEWHSRYPELLEQALKEDAGNTKIVNYFQEKLEKCYTIWCEFNAIDLLDCTIVIPTYHNTEEQIQEMLHSISCQSANNHLQVLVVDDGNEVPIDEAKLKMIADPVPLNVIRLNSNCGVGYARRAGQKMVQTPLIMFADMDDYLCGTHTLWKFLSVMTYNQDIFGIRGNELYINAESQQQIIHGEFYECNTLHGLCCRVADLIKYNILFKPLQYGEDGLFIAECQVRNLYVKTLDEVFYCRRTGALTRGVETSICNLNDLTDAVCIIQRLGELQNVNDNNDFEDERYSYLISWIKYLIDHSDFCQPTEQKEHEDSRCYPQYLRDTFWTDQERAILHTYFVITAISTLPGDLLIRIRRDLWQQGYIEAICLIDSLLLEVQDLTCPYFDSPMSLRLLEDSARNIVKHRLDIIHEQFADRVYLPHQALRHFPWFYKKYEWR